MNYWVCDESCRRFSLDFEKRDEYPAQLLGWLGLTASNEFNNNDVKCAWQISLYSTFSMVFHLQGSNNLQNHGDHMWHKIKVCWLSLLTCMPTCFSSHERNIFRSSTSCTYRLQGGPTSSGQIRMEFLPYLKWELWKIAFFLKHVGTPCQMSSPFVATIRLLMNSGKWQIKDIEY